LIICKTRILVRRNGETVGGFACGNVSAYAKPKPKSKYVVIAYIDPTPHGFFINSIINTFIKKRPYLLACEAKIISSQHNFLRYDSYVDCRDIFPFYAEELFPEDSQGMLSKDAIIAVKKAISQCSVLAKIHKKRALQ